MADKPDHPGDQPVRRGRFCSSGLQPLTEYANFTHPSTYPAHMDTAISTDGTTIAHTTIGHGPLLVIVGGALADHAHYAPLAAELAGEFRVRTYDRRGRGASGDTEPYAVEREVEDLLAVTGDEDALVYGHSAGAALALRAVGALQAAGAVRGLVLADLPYDMPDDDARTSFAEETARVRALHDTGDHAAVAALFLTAMGLPAQDAEAAAVDLADIAKTLPYDYAVLGDGTVPLDAFPTRTLVLAADGHDAASQALVDSLPNARLALLPASTHELEPAAVAAAVLPFLRQAQSV